MAMVEDVPIPLVGATYQSRSAPVSNQVTRNFYVEVNPQASEPVSLQSFPGNKPFATTGVGAGRGTGVLKGIFYTVSGNELYSVDDNKVATLIGTIEGSGLCVLQSDGTNLVITTGQGKPYTYNGVTLTQGTDADLPNANTVAFINRRVVYDGTGGDIVFADLDNPLSVNSANVVQAESNPDDTIAVFTDAKQVGIFGEKSFEPWYNSGTGNPPYSRVNNAVKQIGLAAVHSVSQNKVYTYFLADDLGVYRISGLTSENIGNPAIGQAIASYSDQSDAFGECFTFHNQNFYLLTFPTGNQSWLFNEESGLWTNLASGTDGSAHLMNSYQFVYGKHLISDRTSGNIYELDFDTFTDNGKVIQRQRDTVAMDGEFFGKKGQEFTINKLQLEIETGASLVSAEAVLIMQWSIDNGRTWSSELWEKIGAQGEYLHQLQWFNLGPARSVMFRFRMTDPIKWVLLSASIDVEFSGG